MKFVYHEKVWPDTKNQLALPLLNHVPSDFVFPDDWEPVPVLHWNIL